MQVEFRNVEFYFGAENLNLNNIGGDYEDRAD